MTSPIAPTYGPWRDLIVKHLPSTNGKLPNQDGWISINCPLHADTSQSAGINVESGRFICHSPSCQDEYLTALQRSGTGSKSLSLIELFHFVYRWPLSDASTVVEGYRVDRLDSDFAHDDNTYSSTNGETVIHFFPFEVEQFVREANQLLDAEFLNCDIALGYAGSRNLSKATLVQGGVGYVPGRRDLPDGTTSGVHGCLLLPYWFKDRLVGVRIRQADSRKRMLKASHYIPYNLNSVFDSTSRTVVVGEGESDTLRLVQALRNCGYDNIPVVGTPGVKFDQQWSRFFSRFNRIIAVPQADAPSQQHFTQNLIRTFNQRVEVVQIPWEDDALGGKDVCDYLLMRPKQENDFVELLGVSGQDTEERPYLKSYTYFQERVDKPIDWLIPNVIERGSKVLLVGDPKVGKTFIALNLIESLLTGKSFMDYEPWTPTSTADRCLLVEEEGSERALTQRILKIITPTTELGVIHGEGVKLDDPTSFDRLRRETMKFRPDIIVLDPYASLHNQDENTVEGTMRVMGAVNVLYRALPGSTIVILHHRSKLGGGARGSGALWGAVDYQIVTFKPENSKRTVGLTIEGREVDSDAEALYFEFDPQTMTYAPSNQTAFHIVKSAQAQVDPFVKAEVQRILEDAVSPLSTTDIQNQLTGIDYMVVREVLLQLYAEQSIEREGKGGRGGYRYRMVESR